MLYIREQLITPSEVGKRISPTHPLLSLLTAQDEAGSHWSIRTGFLQNGDESFAHFPLIATLSGGFFL
jgi:hypothetical protein